jgi:hypothetical protein
VVRYGNKPLSFTEAVCLKAFLQLQRPDKFYLHSQSVDLSSLGKYWKQLYAEPGLGLAERLRVKMARDPSELAILGADILGGSSHHDFYLQARTRSLQLLPLSTGACMS